MAVSRPLEPEQLARRTDPKRFSFGSTADLEDLPEPPGQARAIEALQFATEVRNHGFNLFVMGPTGAGKHSLVRELLAVRAAESAQGGGQEDAAGEVAGATTGAPAATASSSKPVVYDWCYVNDFETPYKPRLLRLPAGCGVKLRHDMEHLVEELKTSIPAAFESQEYQTRLEELSEEVKEHQEQAMQSLAQDVQGQGLRLLRTPSGFAFAPVHDNEVMGPEEFAKLPEEEQTEIQKKISHAQDRMQEIMREFLEWTKQSRAKVRELNEQITMAAVGGAIDELRERYKDCEQVLVFLATVAKDVVTHVDDFRKPEGNENPMGLPIPQQAPSFERYSVNVLAPNDASSGRPVVFEENPNYQNVFGRVDHRAEFGALKTDFSLIKAGAMHRANGGFLVLDARKVLMQPFVWDALKTVLRTGQLRLESPAQGLGLVSTVSLEPEPMPVDVKVVLLGERQLYYLLGMYDPDFGELFKVVADFEDRIERDEASEAVYARLVATMARKNECAHFDATGVARLIDQASRMTDDSERLSAHMGAVADLVREASWQAGRAGRELVSAADVEAAVAAQIRRQDRIRALVHEQITRGTVLIDTDGERVGQINGLAVLGVGGFAFGQPARITATARVGSGEIVDIEREAHLGGATHTKGVMILSNFLAWRYAGERPLSLAASLVFEQSYCRIDGDSASMAELCSLLSALSGAPIRQSWAMTGSVNQYGQSQAIGGVNEKIEGFFDICRARGLTGEQGVIIPAANVKHLMLRDDVVAACAEGKFRVVAIHDVDEAVELLTGVEAGAADGEGNYPEASINGRVEARLRELFELRKRLSRESKDDKDSAERDKDRSDKPGSDEPDPDRPDPDKPGPDGPPEPPKPPVPPTPKEDER